MAYKVGWHHCEEPLHIVYAHPLKYSKTRLSRHFSDQHFYIDLEIWRPTYKSPCTPSATCMYISSFWRLMHCSFLTFLPLTKSWHHPSPYSLRWPPKLVLKSSIFSTVCCLLISIVCLEMTRSGAAEQIIYWEGAHLIFREVVEHDS